MSLKLSSRLNNFIKNNISGSLQIFSLKSDAHLRKKLFFVLLMKAL